MEHDDDNRDCNDCLYDFLKLEYETGVSLVKDLDGRRINYQRFFITLITVVSSLSIALLNFYSKFETKVIILKHFTPDRLIGFLLLVSAIMGYGIIRNLASIRLYETFFKNMLLDIRQTLVNLFGVEGYVTLIKTDPDDRTSSDYISIFVSSLINFFILIFGIVLMTHQSNFILMLVPIFLVSGVYGALHIFTIENHLKHKIRTEPLDLKRFNLTIQSSRHKKPGG